ncbi:Senescence-associated protein [Castilleja foliolosa]|uniref:Senescence-associated protein n=1 Tax=Castilleja foliolosa TaxID=1961234 RepID=A0ABD3C9L8_9LAMI
MASQDHPNPNRNPMYPQVMDDTAPTLHHSSSSSLYPTIDMNDLFPDPNDEIAPGTHPYPPPSAPPEPIEESLITVPGAILHLIDKHRSVELATGDLQLIRLRQGDNIVTVFASVADEIQWPLTKELAAVKLDSSHYFFSFKPPPETQDSDSSSDDEKNVKKKKKAGKKNKKAKEEDEVLSCGLTIVSKGMDVLLKDFDLILETYSNFSVQKVEEKGAVVVEAGKAAREISAGELKSDIKKKDEVEGQCAVYWTILAPNVEEYSGTAAKLIATGSGQLVKGILWCGDVTIDRLKWGNEVLKKRMAKGDSSQIDPATLRRIKRVKRVTKMTEKVANGVLSGVVKVSGFFSSSVANSKVGKKFFGLLPGEMVLASLDGFSRICDAVEIAGKNVMSTSSTVTTGLVSHRHGEEAGKATSEGLDAAGHAAGTAWAVFKIRKALTPQSIVKPGALAKSAAAEMRAKASK